MKVAIIGAGPAGLTCASILLKAGISVKVFERDESPSARSQGGTLDLHPESGQAALKAAGLFEQFQKSARYEGEDLALYDRHGKCHAKVEDTETGRPEIDRTVLREMLLNSIPADTIRWASNLRHAEVGKLQFAHGTETDFDLIIGADGAWSKVRHLVTPVNPFYSGISGVELRLSDIDTRHPELSRRVGRGSLFAFGEENGRALLCQRLGDKSVRIYAIGWKPEQWIRDCGVDFADGPAARAAILADYDGWAEELRELIRQSDDEVIPRALYMMPLGLRWQTVPGVAVLGDAAHVMTPFAGEGVNVAMTDAMKLAQSIIANQDDLARAVAEFERWMFPVARKVTQKTWDSLLDRFEAGGTEKFAARINAGLQALEKEKAERAVLAHREKEA